MTVETSDRKQTFLGGQSSLVFTFRTLVSNPEYVKVKTVNVSTGVEADLEYSTQFTVVVNSDGIGGTVTVSPTFSTSFHYVVYRETTAVQSSDYDDFNQFPANTIENDLDRTILVAQEQEEELTRSLRYPISASGASTELPAPVASSFLQWNATADALINAAIPDPSTLIKASSAEAVAGVEDTHFMTPAKTAQAITALGAVQLVTSSTTDITVITGATTTIVSVNAATGGTNKILRLDASGKIPALDGSLLTNLSSTLKAKVVAFTRDISLTGSDQAVTGVGFSPKSIIFFATINSTAAISWGMYDGTTSSEIGNANGTGTLEFSIGSRIIYLTPDGVNGGYAVGKTLDSDGFTVTWSKFSSGTGTATVYALCFG